jgi:Proteobacterial lipase chaperone protein
MTNKRPLVFVAVCICVLVVVFLAVKLDTSENDELLKPAQLLDSAESLSDTVVSTSGDTTAEIRKEMESKQVQGLANDAKNQSMISDNDKQRIYALLSKIELDGDGNVVIDHNTLLAIDGALGYNALNLDDQGLVEFQEAIKVDFKGEAGEQIAELVGNYYRFLDARKEFDTRHVDTTDIALHKIHFDELAALREAHLGMDVAQSLFRKTNTDARYMLDSIALEENTTLSPEEKKQRQIEITQRYQRESIAIPNWEQRYQSFLKEKQSVLDSTLSNLDKREHLAGLLNQHFSEEEINQVSFMKLEAF